MKYKDMLITRINLERLTLIRDGESIFRENITATESIARMKLNQDMLKILDDTIIELGKLP